MLQRNSSAAQEQFAASVQALKANWVLCVESATMPWPKVMASAIPEIASMLDRMASDPRMQPIWIFLTTWPSEVREQFLKSVVLSARDAELTPKRRKQINEKLRHIAGARSAVRTLQKLGSKPLGTVCET